MKGPKSPVHPGSNDRRSSLDRRWIKAQYQGEERRQGKDRRSVIDPHCINKELPVPEGHESQQMAGYKKLLVSNTIQLEALTRVLLDKGIVTEKELLAMMHAVQLEYQRNSES